MSTAPLVDNRKDSTGHTFTYKTVELKDGNIWLAENFNYFVDSPQEEKCQGYDWPGEDLAERSNGCYYQWPILTSNVIPEGWHMPSVDEWNALMSAYGGGEKAYNALVEGGNSGFNLTLGGGTYFTKQGCDQLAIQGLGYFWSSSEGDDRNFAALVLIDRGSKKAEVKYLRKNYLFSVRLIKNK